MLALLRERYLHWLSWWLENDNYFREMPMFSILWKAKWKRTLWALLPSRMCILCSRIRSFLFAMYWSFNISKLKGRVLMPWKSFYERERTLPFLQYFWLWWMFSRIRFFMRKMHWWKCWTHRRWKMHLSYRIPIY